MKKIINKLVFNKDSRIEKIYSLLNKKHLVYLSILLLGMIINSLFEFLSLGIIPIVITALIDLNMDNSMFIGKFYEKYMLNFSLNELVIYLSLLLLIVFFLKTIFIIFLNFFENKLMHKITTDLANNIFNLYLYSSYLNLKNKNSSDIIRNVTHVIDGVRSIIVALLKILREVFVVIAIYLLLALNYPTLANSIFIIIGVFTILFYKLLTRTFEKRGKIVQMFTSSVYKTVSQSVGSIHYIKLFNKEKLFFELFNNQNSTKYKHMFFRRFVATLPRVLLEFIVVLIFLCMMLYFVFFFNDIKEFFPFITLLAICSARLMPSFSIFAGAFSSIKFSIPDLDKIYEETTLMYSQNTLNRNELNSSFNNSSSNFILELKNIEFKYPKNNNFIFKDLNLQLNLGKVIGIYGSSGQGKSTLIEIIMGLLDPISGKVINYGKDIKLNPKNWKSKISYVPQNNYLLDETIEKNISFEDNNKLINYEKIEYAIKYSNLKDFINKLPDKLKTTIGERGSSISGGQLQRIAIARALYRDFDILILDEATNSLDEINENEIIKFIVNLKKEKKLIIMVSHNTKLFNVCDEIFTINNLKLEKKILK